MSDALVQALLMGSRQKSSPLDRQRAYADSIIKQGSSTAPVASPLEGLARALQGGLGGFMAGRADSIQKEKSAKGVEALSAAIAAKSPEERAAAIKGLDPDNEYTAPMLGQILTQQVADERAQQRLTQGVGQLGAGYGMPPQGQPQGGAPAVGGDPATRSQNATAGIESGGRYDAVGPVANSKGQRAYGKYQVMDFNIGPWTQEVLGRPMTPQEFLANPQAQDAVYNAKKGQYDRQYGSPEAGARAWFAGPNGMNKPNASDVNGMTVQNYGQRYAQAYGQGAYGSGGGPQPTTGTAPPSMVAQGNNAVPMPQPPNGMAVPGTPAPMPSGPQVAQGAADPSGTPVRPGAPQVPDVPRPQPSPQQIAKHQQILQQGGYGQGPEAVSKARAAIEQELDRDWQVQRENARMQFGQQTTDYADQRRTQREIEKDDRSRSQPSRQEIEKLHTARSEAATIVSALEDFRREFENTGTWGAIKSVAGATTPVNTAYNTAALLAKGEQLFNLGVLNGPDLDIIRRTLPDPSTPRGAMTSTGDMSAAVGKVVDLLQTRLASREKQLGLPMTDLRGTANELRATMPGGPTPQPSNGPIAPGAIEEGYRFKGGNPADKNSWERVQ